MPLVATTRRVQLKRLLITAVLLLVITGLTAWFYAQWAATQDSKSGEAIISGMPRIETTVSVGAMSGDRKAAAEDAFESIRDTAERLTEQQIEELAEKLTLVLILPKQKLARGETPVIHAYLRNDSIHTAVLLSGPEESKGDGFPTFSWNVTTTDRRKVEPDDPASASSPASVEAEQFGYLKPGDVLDLKVENIQWPYGATMRRSGTYLIQLEYSTDPAHSRTDAECYARFQQDYPDLYSKIPAVTVGSNVVSVSVAE